MSSRIRLMLIGGQEENRESLKSLLQTQDGFDIVSDFGNIGDAIQNKSAIHPNIILVDGITGNIENITPYKHLNSLYPESVFLVIIDSEQKQQFLNFLLNSEFRYIPCNYTTEELKTAIKTIARGQVYMHPSLATWLVDEYRRLSTELGIVATRKIEVKAVGNTRILTKREIQVLQLLAQGMSNNDIGIYLGLSPKTIARHRERIMKKLNIHTRTDLVIYALKTGVINFL